MSWVWWSLGILALAWVLFHLFVPLTLLKFADRMSPGRIPGEIIYGANAHHVHYYTGAPEIVGKGYAFSIWMLTKHAVILNKQFLVAAHPLQIRFVLAHELGHCALGHLWRQWIWAVTGLRYLPFMQKVLDQQEEDANRYAEGLTGLLRSVLKPDETTRLLYNMKGKT